MRGIKKNIRGFIIGVGMMLCFILAVLAVPEKTEAAAKSPYYFDVTVKRGNNVSTLRVYVTYKGSTGKEGFPDFAKSQEVELSEELISDSNPFNLHLTTKSIKTYRGNVQDPDQSPKPREPKEDIAGNTVYISGQYSILVSEYGTVDGLGIGFSYDRPAYTYIDDTSTDNKATGYRINANRYNWNNKADSTLNTIGINMKKQQDTFYLQVHQHNTGATSTDKNCHAGYIMTLENPSLTVEYYSDGKLVGTDMNAVEYKGGTDEMYAVKTFTRLNLTKKGYHADAPEWVTADGKRSFSAGQSYTAYQLKPFDNTEKFKTKTVKLEAQWEGNGYTMTLDANGGKFGNGDLAKQIKVTYGKSTGNDQSGKTLVRDGYDFLGFYTKKIGGVQIFGPEGACKKDGTYWNSKKKWCYLGNATFYAHWEKNSKWNIKKYTITLNPNGGTLGGSTAIKVLNPQVSCGSGNWNHLASQIPTRKGYIFEGWYTAKTGGTLVYDSTGTCQKGSYWSATGSTAVWQYAGDAVFYAHWRNNSFNVVLHAGTGIESVSGDGRYEAGSPVTISAKVKPGYHWSNWTGTEEIASQVYTFTMPSHDMELTASGEANRYTIHFDANKGAEVSHIADIVAEYDTEVTLPDIIGIDGTAAYVKYTLDGVNVTQDVLTGSLPQAVMVGLEESKEDAGIGEEDGIREAVVEERETGEFQMESAEESAGEGDAVEVEMTDKKEAVVPIQKVYPSVFLGWALEDKKDALAPQ